VIDLKPLAVSAVNFSYPQKAFEDQVPAILLSAALSNQLFECDFLTSRLATQTLRDFAKNQWGGAIVEKCFSVAPSSSYASNRLGQVLAMTNFNDFNFENYVKFANLAENEIKNKDEPRFFNLLKTVISSRPASLGTLVEKAKDAFFCESDLDHKKGSYFLLKMIVELYPSQPEVTQLFREINGYRPFYQMLVEYNPEINREEITNIWVQALELQTQQLKGLIQA